MTEFRDQSVRKQVIQRTSSVGGRRKQQTWEVSAAKRLPSCNVILFTTISRPTQRPMPSLRDHSLPVSESSGFTINSGSRCKNEPCRGCSSSCCLEQVVCGLQVLRSRESRFRAICDFGFASRRIMSRRSSRLRWRTKSTR